MEEKDSGVHSCGGSPEIASHVTLFMIRNSLDQGRRDLNTDGGFEFSKDGGFVAFIWKWYINDVLCGFNRVAGSSMLELSDVTSNPLCSNANGVKLMFKGCGVGYTVPVGQKIYEVVGDGIVWVWVVMVVEVLLVVLSFFPAYRGPWEIWQHGLHGRQRKKYNDEQTLTHYSPAGGGPMTPSQQGEYDMWKLRIEQYFQVQEYALWDVIENGNLFKPAAQTTTNAEGSSTTLITGPVTADEKTQKKNDVKARSIFGGNDATKKTRKILLKQMRWSISTHKLGHFARECRGPRNQDNKSMNQDNSRRTINVAEISSKTMLAIDGAGFNWSFIADEEVP
ncbi:hypothetical protein Tco_1446693, partial [Tanacetum coccineum]